MIDNWQCAKMLLGFAWKRQRSVSVNNRASQHCFLIEWHTVAAVDTSAVMLVTSAISAVKLLPRPYRLSRSHMYIKQFRPMISIFSNSNEGEFELKTICCVLTKLLLFLSQILKFSWQKITTYHNNKKM